MFWYSRHLWLWLWYFNWFIWKFPEHDSLCHITELYLSFCCLQGIEGSGTGCVWMSCIIESSNYLRLWAKWTGKLLATWSLILLSSKYPRMTTGEHRPDYTGCLFMQHLITVSPTFAYRPLFGMQFLRFFRSVITPVHIFSKYFSFLSSI